ncbi:MAG: cyclic nucleotide-binding/CBS domain-containing protein [Nitrospirales bacterium]|nr:CBS domain-containing protein [Nitrospirales bacterium]
MNIAGMPATGYETVGDIVGTHMSQYHFQADVSSVVMDMLSDHTSMAPVVNNEGHLVGLIGEVEILNTLRVGRDIGKLKVGEIMNPDRTHLVTEQTAISEALRLFQDTELSILPVIRNGKVIESITRHDLIRAMSGAGLGVEK